MSTAAGGAGNAFAGVRIRKIELDDPWRWLAAGWRDLWRAPVISLGYGLGFTVISLAILAGLFYLDLTALVLAMAAGFMLVGPMLAVGLYEASRRLEAGQAVSAAQVVFVSTRSPTQLAFVGVSLMLVMLAWMRIAMLLFALFFGTGQIPPLDDFVPTLLFTWHGLGLLIVGTLVGGGLALVVFAISAISVPLLMVQELDFISAMVVSARAVRENPLPMLLWAWLIVLITACGLATAFFGLTVTFPLIGHATWHAYRGLVEASPAVP